MNPVRGSTKAGNSGGNRASNGVKKVRVRFPPSPTGYCHVGTARMALLNYLFAKKNGGDIVFRIEDTDRARSTKEFEDDIVDSISWIGLAWDEFYRQSERTSIYVEALQKLIAEDKAYVSEEESKKEPGTMVKVVRLRNPGTSITFTDIVRGNITFDTKELGDFAIARAIDDPLYHLTVVVDDASMHITHVIRGEEHISNTPRQILIQEALGYERPQYAHYPLFLGSDRSKLSKRKGDVAVREYRNKGYLPQALLNYIGTLGWTPPSGKELLTLSEMIDEFDLKDLHKSGAVFDMEKLNWYNRMYLSQMREDDFNDEALRVLEEAIAAKGISWNENTAHKLVPLIRERISVWEDLRVQVREGEYDFFFIDPPLDLPRIAEKKSTPAGATTHLLTLLEFLEPLASFSEQSVKDAIWPYAAQSGRGAVLWPFRYALTGRDTSPDPFIVASIIGKETSLRRVRAAIQLLEVL
ncbi:glutamate--tRNA ligase [Candidatus Kaiserbacteria bacterium]|nr:glutamate--tRNA ligase [Candidatus Kaiserbacteria bacterium]